jgi:protein-export membrane protein SecD
MWKKRILALLLLIIAAAIGYFVYWSQVTNKKPFKLGLDLSGGSYLVYNADVSKVPAGDVGDSMNSLRDIIERRVNLFGVSEPRVSTETSSLSGTKEYHLIVELPGVTDVKQAISMIGQTPLLEFKVENPNYKAPKDGVQEISLDASSIKDGKIDISAAMGASERFVSALTPLTGQYLSRATVQFDPTTQAPIVALQFNAEGAKIFEDITAKNIGKSVAIYLDGAAISTPTVNQKIAGGQAVITGNFTATEAKQLVGRLNSGALPVPVTLISTDTIGPTLGTGAIHAGILAGLIGFLAIAFLLIFWYRLPGLLGAISLVIYAIVSLALFKLIPITLTSAGMAGFIISLGMAVDANILIFERMKEEMHDGKSIMEAIKIGFDRAWNSIRDGNTSSILTAIILFWFGSTLIQGFALTFGLGVIISMISAIVVTRTFLYAVAGLGNGRIKRFLYSSGISK